MRDLRKSYESFRTFVGVEPNFGNLETLPEILRHQEQTLKLLEQRTQQISQVIEEMRVEQNQQEKQGLWSHPLQVNLQGKQLSLKTVLGTFGVTVLLSMTVATFLTLKLAPVMLNRLDILQRINNRVNSVELNQRKILEQLDSLD